MADEEIALGEERIEHQLELAKKVSSKLLADEPDKTKSAYIVHEAGNPESFCGETISYYNIYLRHFYTATSCLVVLCFFLSSYILCFDSADVFFNIGVAADVAYIYVMFFRSRTGHMIDGVEERNLLKVRERYQTSVICFLDIISFIPVSMLRFVVPGNNDQMFYVIGRQKQYGRLYFILSYLGSREEEPGSSTLIYRTLKFLLLSSLTIHWLGCAWYSFACARTEEAGFDISFCAAGSWIMYLPESIQQKVESIKSTEVGASYEISFLHNTYITSLYWSAATATSTGYGDIHAYTLGEKLFSVFAMIIGMMIVYGMTMGGITSMLTNIDARRSSFVHQYVALKRELNNMHVSEQVISLCTRYYDYLWHRWEGEDVQENGMLLVLPETLRASFSEATFKHLIRKADLLDGTEDAFCRNLSLVAKPKVYLENQFIQRCGEIASSMCYLQHGIIEILDEDENEVVALLNEGKLFGQVLLVFDLPRINSIRCKTNCDLFVLEKSDFRQVLSEYPNAAKAFVEATRKKCEGGDNWPMEPPSIEEFNNFAEKNSKRKRKMSLITSEKLPSVMSGAEVPLTARRMTTVHSTEYEGIDLSRVILAKQERDQRDIDDALAQEVKPSLVDFLTGKAQETKLGRRSSTKLRDGTQMIANNANYEDLKDAVSPNAEFEDPDKTTLKERLFQLTVVDPDSKFTAFWQLYIFAVAFFTGIYSTFMAFFVTTPGVEQIFYGDNATTKWLTNVINDDTCDNTGASACVANSGASLNDMVTCLNSTRYSRIILKSDTPTGYSLVQPATYDISMTGYNTATADGLINILIAYFILDVSFLLNIFINLRTSVKTANGIKSDFSDIWKNYNKWHKLWLDIVCLAPLEILAPLCGCTSVARFNAMTYLRCNRVLYFLRFVPKQFTKWEYSLDVNIIRVRTLKFIVYIYTFTHCCSCVFYFWSCSYSIQNDQIRFEHKCRYGSWAWVFDLTFQTSRIQDYIKTMYWASTTMTSTGYGDISASTTTGRVFALSTMIIGTVMYGWLIAVIASTVSNSEAAIVSFANSMVALKTYLVVHAVPKGLVKQVLDCRRIEWLRYYGTAIPGVKTIGKQLPDQLHSVLLYESVSKFINQLPFFHDVDTSFTAMLCNYVQMYNFAEGDIIIYEGDLSRNLYIIKQGHCDVVTEDMKSIVDHLRPGDYFGEAEILFGCGSPRTVVADTEVEVLVLSIEDINSVLKSFPILQTQMENIEHDEAYKERLLNAIAQRKNNIKTGVNMLERFTIETIEGGTKIYSEKLRIQQLVQRMSTKDKAREEDIHAALHPVKKFLTHFLLPVTFGHQSKPYIIYETVRLFLIIITLLIVPLQAAVYPNDSGLMTIQYLLDFLCFVDQYIKLHTTFYNEKGVLVSQSTKTAINYLKTSFIIDFFSYFPIELIAMGCVPSPFTVQQWKLFCILRFLRILQAWRMFCYFNYWLDDVRYSRRWVKHLSSVVYGMIIHHWMGCLLLVSACPPDPQHTDYSDPSMYVQLNATGMPHYCVKDSWVGRIVSSGVFPALDLVNVSADQYIIGLYWATATLVCVGYGDIHAVSLAGMFMATVVMISGTVYYSYVLGDVAANIQTDDIPRGHYKGRLSDIIKFFKVYDVNKETQRQVLDYYCYLWDRTKGVSPNDLLLGLPPSLRTNVCQSMYDAMIREAFGEGDSEIDKETEGFFRLVTTRIKPSLYLKQSVICRRDDVGDEMFFIQRGNVAIMKEDDEGVATVLGPGQHFGEVALLFASPRQRTIKALTNCDLNVLSKEDLDEILSMFPKFRAKMTNIAQDRKLKGTSSVSYVRPPSKADLTQDILYDQSGNRIDGTDRQKFAKVLSSTTTFALVWKHITVLLCFYSACATVYQACFLNHNYNMYIINYLIDIWFVLDMIISFHMSYFDDFKTDVDSREKIHTRYAKTPKLFLLDTITNIPIELLSPLFAISGSTITMYQASRLTWLAYLRLLRVLRMNRLISIFAEWEKNIRQEVLVIRMYKFALGCLFAINTCGSIFYLISCPMGRCGQYGWTQASATEYRRNSVFGFHLLPWVDSIYWAVATMTSTGYGDIKPETQSEMVYSSFIMVLGKIIIGYVLGQVAATLANDESLRVWYEQRVQSVKKYMTDLKFSNELFQHVVQYYDYMWMKNQGVNIMNLFPDLSFSLRADIYDQICRSMVDTLNLFEGCPENFLRHLCLIMKPTSYMPGDYICMQGDIRSEMYVMHNGVAEAFKIDEAGNKIPIRLILQGENFLMESVLAKVRRPCTLRARTYVDVFTMSLEDLQQVIRYHPEAKVTILQNARNIFPDLNLEF